jgi:DNA-directed RNA polymerase specialized sigma subunit
VPSCIIFDDLVSAGMIGQIQAVDRFEGDRDLKFTTYAQHRIQGAMLDFVRDEDALPLARRGTHPARNSFRYSGISNRQGLCHPFLRY